LVWALADMGIECTVIAPVPVNQYLSTYKKQPLEAIETTSNGAKIKLYFPRYFTFGQRKIFGYSTSRITTDVFYKTVLNVWENKKINVDVVYGHFTVPAGIVAARLGKKYNIPAFSAYGEATPRDLILYGLDKLKKEMSSIKGMVAVSSASKDTLEELDIISKDKIEVFPNGFQQNVFHLKDKNKSREKFGFDKDIFIIAYVGQFTHRKGILRLAKAVKGLNDVFVAYAGKGELKPDMENCIFQGAVNPRDMADFLNAADIFVMPTLNEGCSNAIVEAIACGLPIVSSDLPFNKDILDDKNAILVDPLNIEEIRRAIIELRDNPKKREEKREASLDKAKMLTMGARAYNIKSWIENAIK